MDLVLVLSPGKADERIFPLATGRNTLGSAAQNHIRISSPRVHSHHLNIESNSEGLQISSARPDALFSYAGALCHTAILQSGEKFSVDGVEFECRATSAVERTELGFQIPRIAQQKSAPIPAPATQAPSLSQMQVSGFAFQKRVDHFPLLIGRNEKCDVVLNHPQVSGFHARIDRSSNGVHIEDLRSSNGTYVDDRLIQKAPLIPGEPILIMPYLILFTGEFLNIYTLQQQSQLIGWQISVSAGEKKIIDRATLACSS
ncbi:MAG TPA: FHA domain-containing protein, partial [Acidobacteriota bacterium]